MSTSNDRNWLGMLVFAWMPVALASFVTWRLLANIATGSIVDVSSVHWVRATHLPATALLAVLLMGTVLTIAIGTLLFFFEVTSLFDHQDPKKGLQKAAIALTFVSLAICMVWAGVIGSSGFHEEFIAAFGEWIEHYVHELFALTLFFFFLIIDLLLVAASARLGANTTSSDRRDELKRFKAFSADSLLFIDIPVVVGIAFLIVLVYWLRHHPQLRLPEPEYRPRLNHQHDEVSAFVHGLAVGATCMHLIFSQLIFAFLKSREAFASKGKREMKMTRGRWIGAIAALSALAILSWKIFSSTPRPPVTITVQGEDSSNLAAMKAMELAVPFNPEVHVSFHASKFEHAKEEADASLSQGIGAFDIILQYNFSLAEYVQKDWVVPLSEVKGLLAHTSLGAIDADLFPEAWQEVGYFPRKPGTPPEAIGYPFAANTMLLVYNKRMFSDPSNQDDYRKRYNDELSPPRDWKSFRQLAEFFTSPQKGTYGLALEGAKGGWLYYEWANFAFGMNGGVMKKTRGWEGDLRTPIIVDSPETEEATKFYLGLKPFNGSKDYLSTGADGQRELMRQGKVAMAIMWSDFVYNMAHDDDGRPNNDWGFSPIPGKYSMLAGGTYFINRKSQHLREAAEFVVNLMERENQIELTTKGLCSPMRSVYDDPRVRALPYSHALRESLERGIYMAEAGPDSEAIQQIITTQLQRAWLDQIGVRDALATARKEIEAKRRTIFGGGAR